MDIWASTAPRRRRGLAAMVSFMESVGLTDDVGIKVNSARRAGGAAGADVRRRRRGGRGALRGVLRAGRQAGEGAARGAARRLRRAGGRADVDALAAVLRDAADAGGSLAALEALIGDGPAPRTCGLRRPGRGGRLRDWIVVDASVAEARALHGRRVRGLRLPGGAAGHRGAGGTPAPRDAPGGPLPAVGSASATP